MLLKTSFTLDDIRLLDVTIYEMQALPTTHAPCPTLHAKPAATILIPVQTLFLDIDVYYDLWCFNFHLAQHFPMDILRFGPTRLTSTLRWEAQNQTFIQAGRATNFKSLLFSMADTVAVRRAQVLVCLTA